MNRKYKHVDMRSLMQQTVDELSNDVDARVAVIVVIVFMIVSYFGV